MLSLREPPEQAYAREHIDADRQYWLDNFRCDLQDALHQLGPHALRQLVEDAIAAVQPPEPTPLHRCGDCTSLMRNANGSTYCSAKDEGRSTDAPICRLFGIF